MDRQASNTDPEHAGRFVPRSHLMASPVLLSDEQVAHFIVNGYLVLPTDLPEEFHSAIYSQAETFNLSRAGKQNSGNNILPLIPALANVYRSPVVHGALQSLLGPDYQMHPHRHPHMNRPGFAEQRNHRDSFWGFIKPRHHTPMMLMAMYYPQDTPLVLGPTGIAPMSQYLSRLSSTDRHAAQMPKGWCVSETPMVCTKGCVVIIHYDIWHKGLSNKGLINRYMFKFQFVRMKPPTLPSWASASPSWPLPEVLPRPLMPVWNYIWHWMRGDVILHNPDACVLTGSSDHASHFKALHNISIDGEVARLHSAYTLAATGDEESVSRLAKLLLHREEPVRRSAGYGLTAVSDKFARIALAGLISAAKQKDDEICANATFFLGELGARGLDGLPVLVENMSSGVTSIRRNASEAIGNMLMNIKMPLSSTQTAIWRLIDAVSCDSDEQVRFQAALSLGRMANILAAFHRIKDSAPLASPSPSSTSPLLTELGDMNIDQSNESGKDIVQAVSEALALAYERDANRYTRAYALDALQRIGSPWGLAFVLRALWAARWCPLTSPASQW